MIASAMSAFAQADSVSTGLTDDEIYSMYEHFLSLQTRFEGNFSVDDSIAYWKYANNIRQDENLSQLINVASACIGEAPDEEFYVEILTTLITLQEYELYLQVSQQSDFDNLKGSFDYLCDLAFAYADTINLHDKFDNKKSLEVKKLIEACSGSLTVTKDNLDEWKYYKLTVRRFANAADFLNAIIENTDNTLLRSAAEMLLNANDSLLEERLKYIAETAIDVGTAVTKIDLDDFLTLTYDMLIDPDSYSNDRLLTSSITVAGGILRNLFPSGAITFDICTLIGNLTLGTTNTFKRYNEMMALADIADSLVKAYSKIDVSTDSPYDELYNNMYIKLNYYKMLLTVHARGEYLQYSLSVNDAGALSLIVKWFDKHYSNTTRDEWYETQNSWFSEYYSEIQQLLTISQKTVVQDDFKLHFGFISQIDQKSVPPKGYVGIYDADDLELIRSDTTGRFILMNDIVLPNDYETIPGFSGEFDGNGYTISNVREPLFDILHLGAIVRNLGVNVNYTVVDKTFPIYYGKYYGAIASGYDHGIKITYENLEDNNALIDNCWVKGNLTIECDTGYIGGMVGYAQRMSMSNCYSSITINISTVSTTYVGGLIGYASDGTGENNFDTEDAKIYNSYYSGTINASLDDDFRVAEDFYYGGICGYTETINIECCLNSSLIDIDMKDNGLSVKAGGIVGATEKSTYYAKDSKISKCINEGNIMIGNKTTDPDLYFSYVYAGGIVGCLGNTIIDKCSNKGLVSSNCDAGGIVGYMNIGNGAVTTSINSGYVGALQAAGGIVAKVDKTGYSITDCINVGTIYSPKISGGITGTRGYAKIQNCYYSNTMLSAEPYESDVDAYPLDKYQLSDSSSYKGFDFDNTWVLEGDMQFPKLKY